MSWRIAESLEKYLEQLNAAAPGRSTISDGGIGDTAHSNRTSDHNPWCGPGVVTARDFTHDPEKGANMHEWAEALRQSKDPRIKYVIWDKRMFSSYPTSTHAAWTWRPYTGINLHTQHMHLSVNCDGNKDSTRAWATPEKKEWDEMATKQEIKDAVRDVVKQEVQKAIKKLAVGKTQKGYDPDRVNLKSVEERLSK